MSTALTVHIENTPTGVTVCSPGVGLWRGGPADGHLVCEGETVGDLIVLGVPARLLLPRGARGVVANRTAPGARETAVAFGTPLFEIDPLASSIAETAETAENCEESEGTFLRAPSAGRFYSRPAPDKAPFITEGDSLDLGQTAFVLEVMKTFTRVPYGGPGLPTKAKVVRILVEDGADVEAGDAVLEVEGEVDVDVEIE